MLLKFLAITFMILLLLTLTIINSVALNSATLQTEEHINIVNYIIGPILVLIVVIYIVTMYRSSRTSAHFIKLLSTNIIFTIIICFIVAILVICNVIANIEKADHDKDPIHKNEPRPQFVTTMFWINTIASIVLSLILFVYIFYMGSIGKQTKKKKENLSPEEQRLEMAHQYAEKLAKMKQKVKLDTAKKLQELKDEKEGTWL